MNSAHELRTLVDALIDLRERSRTGALATLTRTRGSTFRRVGTSMLVHDDGGIVCELSGGCPQRDIVERAQDAMRDGTPRIVRYNAANGLDLMIEMGCGGELDILIEPLVGPHCLDFVDALDEGIRQRRPGRLVTLFALNGQAVPPRRQVWFGGERHYDGIGDARSGSAGNGTTTASATPCWTRRSPSPHPATMPGRPRFRCKRRVEPPRCWSSRSHRCTASS